MLIQRIRQSNDRGQDRNSGGYAVADLRRDDLGGREHSPGLRGSGQCHAAGFGSTARSYVNLYSLPARELDHSSVRLTKSDRGCENGDLSED